MKKDLETRDCACGCGKVFRCMQDSPSKYVSITHQFKTIDTFASEMRSLKEKKAAARRALYDRLEQLVSQGFNATECARILNAEGHRIKGDSLTARRVHSTAFRLNIRIKEPR